METKVQFIGGGNLDLRGDFAKDFYDSYTYALSTNRENFTVTVDKGRAHYHMSKIVCVTVGWEE